MTMEQLISKAHYFGANIGNEFVYNDLVRLELIGVYFIKEQSILQIIFDGESGLLKTLEMPKDIEMINKLKFKEDGKIKRM